MERNWGTFLEMEKERENDKRIRKWRGDRERMRKWRERK